MRSCKGIFLDLFLNISLTSQMYNLSRPGALSFPWNKIQQGKRYRKHLAKANKYKLFVQNGEQNAKFTH